jgi:hypothetical protein
VCGGFCAIRHLRNRGTLVEGTCGRTGLLKSKLVFGVVVE